MLKKAKDELDTQVGQDTIVIINGWAMQRDPQLCNDATCFKPGKFDGEGEEKKLVWEEGLAQENPWLCKKSVSFTLELWIQCFD